jgi:hypothetical protein
MTTRPIGRAAGAAALALMLWQCGGGEDGATVAAAGQQVDACDLVPREEVAALVGVPVDSAEGRFNEHTYTDPVTYTASCMYTGGDVVMLTVHYPVAEARGTSADLASRLTEWLHSSEEDDPSIEELYRSTEVRPVAGLAGPAAEYDMLGQTTLEARLGRYQVKVAAPSPESARGIAAKALERLR